MSNSIMSRTGREDRTYWTLAIDAVPGPNNLPPKVTVTGNAGQIKLGFPIERDELEAFIKRVQGELKRWAK